MKFLSILNKPHPFIFNRYSVLLPSLITFLILVLLRPFEFDTFSIDQLLIWSFIFAAIIGLTVLGSVSAIIKLLGKPIRENWNLKNEILMFLFVLAMISLVIFALFLMLNPKVNKIDLFSLVVVRTFVISLFPVLILVLYEQNHHQKIKRRQAERLNQELLKRKNPLHKKKSNSTLPEKIMLVAENEKIALQVTPASLYFVKSEGNYVEVFYYQNQKIQKELIRNSLKSIEDQLSGFDFFRCHNRFLINLQHIQKVEGNARNFELKLTNVEEKIPVSRNKSEKLLQLFQQKN
ncbi:LytR/AlgR family response regulator transcription factor [Aquiflexum lacus]|uniref:LytR/AlgR family response regulator transcription factor n=1 Tax=Aquiflexum lacus TaxID=2483805 RepID=UPI0018937CAF|nr:LytTR family DNA-binding domain-containing protein [Aquiflexum lacus]